MKTRAFTTMLTAFAGCTLAFAQSRFIPEDDIYYQPNETNKVVESKKATSQKEQPAHARTMYVSSGAATTDSRDVDEYNRRYAPEYEETVEPVSTPRNIESEVQVIYENPDKGYYLNGFSGNNSDYEYAERIRKFHNPKFTVHFSDPNFTDIYFLNSSDWNVYIDDNYAWVTPTWTNPVYWNYMWTPYSYSSLSWRWNAGWGPSWGWGWNGGWGGCYDPFWGPSWGHHHHHYNPHWGHNGYYPNWGHRPSYRPNNVNGTSPRNPYYGIGNGNYIGNNRRPGTTNTTRPGSTVTTRPGTNNDNNHQADRPNTNIRPGNIRPGNIRPGNSAGTNVRPSENSRPSGNNRPSGNVRPSGNNSSVTRPSGNSGTTSRPSGNYTRPSRENSNSSGSYTRPSSESRPNSSSRPSYNNSDNRSSGSSGYGGSRSSGGSSYQSGGSGGRGGRR